MFRDFRIGTRRPGFYPYDRRCDPSVSANNVDANTGIPGQSVGIHSGWSTQRNPPNVSNDSAGLNARNTSVVLSPQPTGTATPLFFELCVNTGRYTISLGEIDIALVASDAELFKRISEKYYELRGFYSFKRWILKPVDVHYVKV